MRNPEQVCGLRYAVMPDGTKQLQFALKMKAPGLKKHVKTWFDVPEENLQGVEDSVETPPAEVPKDIAPAQTVAPKVTAPAAPVQPKPPAPTQTMTTQNSIAPQRAPVVVDTEKMRAAWLTVSDSTKVLIKQKYKTVSAWYRMTGGKNEFDDNKAQPVIAPESLDREFTRTYGEDARDVMAFKQLSPELQVSILTRWKDPYAWYLCERTNTIATGLRDEMDPGQLARHYKLSLDEVKQCRELQKG